MDSGSIWLKPLSTVDVHDAPEVGGKAARLATLARQGYPVPDGFCVTTSAYHAFVDAAGLRDVVRMELGRKDVSQMRWEEMWDAALRIRSAFLAAPIAVEVERAIVEHACSAAADTQWAVRSSAVGEDSVGRSFAGVHESIVGVRGADELLDAVKRVWASLWSDAAILYLADLQLNASTSAMAVLVQPVIEATPSGVAFGRDPRSFDEDRQVVEAVAGPCAELVAGRVEPDRWVLKSSTGEVVDYRRGERASGDTARESSLLAAADLARLGSWLLEIESRHGWPADIEWTGRGDALTLLQARPITARVGDSPDTRASVHALTLTPQRLRELRDVVVDELIPELTRTGERLTGESLETMSDDGLARALRGRLSELRRWRQIYDEQLIPFAHGVRLLGAYYNDSVHPRDPYEFVALLAGQEMIASRRNAALAGLAGELAGDAKIRAALDTIAERIGAPEPVDRSAATRSEAPGWRRLLEEAKAEPVAADFLERLESIAHELMNTAYDGELIDERPLDLLHTVVELSGPEARATREILEAAGSPRVARASQVRELEQRLFDAVGPERFDEARELLAIARQAWRLRDDDNILLARIEAELLRGVDVAAGRLRACGRLADGPVGEATAETLAAALLDRDTGIVELETAENWVARDRVRAAAAAPSFSRSTTTRARQLVGQPAAPGLASGPVTRVLGVSDLGRFRHGDVLVCDALQPMMTHVVPLAAAVVERRGGMLIHGSIIARELGIPCVNGIAAATELVLDGDVVTVDGYLGVVTVGPPELRG